MADIPVEPTEPPLSAAQTPNRDKLLSDLTAIIAAVEMFELVLKWFKARHANGDIPHHSDIWGWLNWHPFKQKPLFTTPQVRLPYSNTLVPANHLPAGTKHYEAAIIGLSAAALVWFVIRWFFHAWQRSSAAHVAHKAAAAAATRQAASIPFVGPTVQPFVGAPTQPTPAATPPAPPPPPTQPPNAHAAGGHDDHGHGPSIKDRVYTALRYVGYTLMIGFAAWCVGLGLSGGMKELVDAYSGHKMVQYSARSAPSAPTPEQAAPATSTIECGQGDHCVIPYVPASTGVSGEEWSEKTIPEGQIFHIAMDGIKAQCDVSTDDSENWQDTADPTTCHKAVRVISTGAVINDLDYYFSTH